MGKNQYIQLQKTSQIFFMEENSMRKWKENDELGKMLVIDITKDKYP